MLDRFDSIDNIGPVELGSILRAQRKSIRYSQGDITQRLGYSNLNFISMIESGKSKIPLSRVMDFAEVYGFEKDFVIVILRVLHRDAFDVMINIASDMPHIISEIIMNPDHKTLDITQKCINNLNP